MVTNEQISAPVHENCCFKGIRKDVVEATVGFRKYQPPLYNTKKTLPKFSFRPERYFQYILWSNETIQLLGNWQWNTYNREQLVNVKLESTEILKIRCFFFISTDSHHKKRLLKSCHIPLKRESRFNQIKPKY